MADLEASILIKVLDAFTSPLMKLADGVDRSKAGAEKLRKAFDLSADLKQSAEGMGKVADAIAGPMKHALNEFRGFEKEMSKVAALSGEIGTEGFGKMREQALELGAATAYSSEEAAQAMAQYAQAGRTVNEILAVTPLTLAAAKANGTELAETAAIIGHTMSGMGIATSETARVVDVLTAGAAASDMNLSDMGQALAYVGPVARQAGMSLELTAAFMGKMKDAGLEASQVGTGLRATISRLLDPSSEATKAFGKLGFNTKQLAELQKEVASGKVDEALRRIGTAADKLPNEKRMALLSQIFGLEASTAANVAITASMNTSGTGLRALEEQLKQSDGTALRLAGVMEDNLDGAIERASGAVSGLSTQVGEILAPSANTAAGTIESMANGALSFAKGSPHFTKATLEFTIAIAGIATVLKAGLFAASAYAAAQASVAKSYAMLTGSLIGRMGLVAAVGLAGYAVGAWINETFQLTERIMNMLGLAAPEKAKKRGMSGGVEVYADGTEIDEHGNVVKLGTGKGGPSVVREAQAAGATTQTEISNYVRGKRAETARSVFAYGMSKGDMLRNESITQEKTFNAVTGRVQGLDPGMMVAAMREQTERTVKAIERSEKATRDLLEEERRNRPRGPAAGGTLAGQGAY